MCPATFNRTSVLAIERTQNSLSQLVPSKPPSRKNQEGQGQEGTGNIPKVKKQRKSILRVKTLDESLDSVKLNSCDAQKTGDLSPILSSGTSSSSSTLSTCTPMSSPSNRGGRSSRKSVCFSEICIREYAMTIGDNPSCSRGAPVSLHWNYDPDHFTCSLHQFEEFRKTNPPRKRAEMIIPMDRRHEMLKDEWNVSTREILSIIKENKKIQEHRHKSALQTDRRIRNEALLENAKNSMRRLISKDT